jgi:hypothetical protein
MENKIRNLSQGRTKVSPLANVTTALMRCSALVCLCQETGSPVDLSVAVYVCMLVFTCKSNAGQMVLASCFMEVPENSLSYLIF